MKSLIARLQADINKWQKLLQKESNDLIHRIKKVYLKQDIVKKRKELEKLFDAKIKKLEPLYSNFLVELRKNAKKAGIDLSKIEKELLRTAKAAQEKLHLGKTKAKKASEKKTSAKKTASPGKVTPATKAKKKKTEATK